MKNDLRMVYSCQIELAYSGVRKPKVKREVKILTFLSDGHSFKSGTFGPDFPNSLLRK